MMASIMSLIISTELDQPEASMHYLTQDQLHIKSKDHFLTLIGMIVTVGIRASSEAEMFGITQDRPFLMEQMLLLVMKKARKKLISMDKSKTIKKQQ